MEEDIKILEKFTNIVKGKDYNAKNGWHGYYDDELIVLGKSIENLIKGYRELEDENQIYKEELEKIDKVLNLETGIAVPYKHEIIESLKRAITQQKKIIDDSIPKSKVKEKIEELNNNRNYLSTFKDWKEKDFTNEDIINNCVEVLQELMEDKLNESKF